MAHDEKAELEALAKDDEQFRFYTILRLRSGEERFDRVESSIGTLVKYNRFILGGIAFLALLYFAHVGGREINLGDMLCKLALRYFGLG